MLNFIPWKKPRDVLPFDSWRQDHKVWGEKRHLVEIGKNVIHASL